MRSPWARETRFNEHNRFERPPIYLPIAKDMGRKGTKKKDTTPSSSSHTHHPLPHTTTFAHPVPTQLQPRQLGDQTAAYPRKNSLKTRLHSHIHASREGQPNRPSNHTSSAGSRQPHIAGAQSSQGQAHVHFESDVSRTDGAINPQALNKNSLNAEQRTRRRSEGSRSHAQPKVQYHSGPIYTLHHPRTCY